MIFAQHAIILHFWENHYLDAWVTTHYIEAGRGIPEKYLKTYYILRHLTSARRVLFGR